MALTSGRLTLVPVRPGHAGEMSRVLADPALYRYTGGAPEPAEVLGARYARIVAGSPDPEVTWRTWVLRLDASGELAGFVQATGRPAEAAAEVAWVVGAPWQGRGLATEAAVTLVGLLAAEGVRTVTARIHPDNVASQRVGARAGLSPTSRWADGERVWSAALG